MATISTNLLLNCKPTHSNSLRFRKIAPAQMFNTIIEKCCHISEHSMYQQQLWTQYCSISICIKFTAFPRKQLFPIKFSRHSIHGSGYSGCDKSLKRKKTLIKLFLLLRYRNVYRNSSPTEFPNPFFKAWSLRWVPRCIFAFWTWNSFSLTLLKLIYGKLVICWQCKFSLRQH